MGTSRVMISPKRINLSHEHSYPRMCGHASLKGKFSSGLEGASAIKQIGGLTREQPCEVMHNNHNHMKIKLV